MRQDLADDRDAAAPFDLLTIGHSNHPLERFMALLAGAGTTAVVDVRSLPSSRRHPWFSAARLREALERAGISYLPMGEALGGRPRDPSLFRDGVADYEAMATRPEFRDGIERLIETAQRRRVSLLCAEREPLDCHRCLLVAPALAACGCRIGHILADGRIVAHEAVEQSLLDLLEDNDLSLTDRAARLAEAYRRRAMAVAFRART